MDAILNPEEWGIETCGRDGGLIFTRADQLRSPRFYREKDCQVLKIDTGCQHTGGSHYPRTELKQKAQWDSTDSRHMNFKVAIIELPKKKPEVCFAQIKTGNAEMQLLLNGSDLICRHLDKKHTPMGKYKLGDWVDVIVSCIGGTVIVNIGHQQCTFKADFKGAHFKCGAYMQSNEQIEGNKTTGCEVHLKNLVLNK